VTLVDVSSLKTMTASASSIHLEMALDFPDDHDDALSSRELMNWPFLAISEQHLFAIV
jgi:hypothetical protein